MNIKLQHLLPTELPDEAALHLVNFVSHLARTLEALYFDQMHHQRCQNEYNPFSVDEENNHDFP